MTSEKNTIDEVTVQRVREFFTIAADRSVSGQPARKGAQGKRWCIESDLTPNSGLRRLSLARFLLSTMPPQRSCCEGDRETQRLNITMLPLASHSMVAWSSNREFVTQISSFLFETTVIAAAIKRSNALDCGSLTAPE